MLGHGVVLRLVPVPENRTWTPSLKGPNYFNPGIIRSHVSDFKLIKRSSLL